MYALCEARDRRAQKCCGRARRAGRFEKEARRRYVRGNRFLRRACRRRDRRGLRSDGSRMKNSRFSGEFYRDKARTIISPCFFSTVMLL